MRLVQGIRVDFMSVTDGRAQLQVYPAKPALGTLDRMDVCAPLPLLSCAPGSRDLRPDANRGAFAGRAVPRCR
jgi:hypothetical protein